MNTLSDTFAHRVRRQISKFRQRAILPAPTQGAIVSFSFDDCPCSAIDTALPILEAEDWRATIYVALGLCDTTNHLGLHMSRQDVVDVYNRGHEIGDHTFSHINAKARSPEIYLADITKNQSELAALGLPFSENFAFPFGDVITPIKKQLRGRFKTLRGVIPPHSPHQDANFLPAMPLYTGPQIDNAIQRIANLHTEPLWLNVFTHDVRDHPSPFGCTPEEFKSIVDAVKLSGARVMTVQDAYETLKREGGSS